MEEDLFHKESESKVGKTIRLNRFLVNEGFYDGPGRDIMVVEWGDMEWCRIGI